MRTSFFTSTALGLALFAAGCTGPETKLGRGINNLTVSLSRALAHTGITVNTVTPGTILTPAVEDWLAAVAKQMQWGDDWATIEKRFTSEMIPLAVDKIGRPDDIAVMVALLASPRGGYATGANMRIDGGHNQFTN